MASPPAGRDHRRPGAHSERPPPAHDNGAFRRWARHEPATKVEHSPACRSSGRHRIMAFPRERPCARLRQAGRAPRGGRQMSEKIYDIPPEWKTARLHRRGQVQGDVRALDQGPERVLGRGRPSASTGIARRPRSRTPPSVRSNVSIKWFEDGVTNVAYNCIDRHLPTRANQVAIIWEGDDPKDDRKITYQELHDEVCRFANILRNRNVEKGDRVTIYLPMIPEAAYAMLACARIGAIHSVVFGGFSPDSLAGRIEDCKSNVRDHRRRRRARRPQGAAQGQYRRRHRQGRRRRSRHRGAPHRRAGRHGSGARRLVPRGRQGGDVASARASR